MLGRAREPHVPLPLQRSRLRAEEKTLDFEFEVLSAQFNQQGRYALRLTVENPLLQGSSAGIQLRVNSGEVTQGSTSTTDTIEQRDLHRLYCFQRRKFTFTLPRGFCKNDKNHDVRLHIEALRIPQRAEGLGRSRQVGEAFFAIYPRPNQPHMKLSARRDEDWYRYSAVMALLRVGSEQPAMHCGRMAFTASLHEHRAPTAVVVPTSLSPSTQEDQQAASPAAASPALDIPASSRLLHTPESAYHSLPTEGHACSLQRLQAGPALGSSPELPSGSADEHPSSSSSSSSVAVPAALSCSSFHLSSPGSSPDLASSPVQVSTSPAGTEDPSHALVAGGGHVARVGKESITIIFHGASNLPTTREGRVPWPYVVIETSRGEEQKPEVTRASSVPTHAPTWEEEVTVEMDAEDVGQAALTLTVADKATKEALGMFQLPVRHLQPFQPHRCRLVLPRTQDPVGMVLHVTITRKGSFITRCDGLSYVALEVLLQGLSAPFATPPGPLVAVARVVTNVQEYKSRMEKHPTSCPGITPTTITFPDPPAAAFCITRAANHGYPQMSRAAGPPEQPTWNSSFLFQGRDVATIFSEDTALAIEYYPYKAMWDAPGTLAPIGYSVLPLTSRVFRELVAQNGGMCVDGLAMQGTDLKTTTGAIPTVRLCLQLLQLESPVAFLTPSGSDVLPRLDPVTGSTLKRTKELRAAPMHPRYCQLHQDDVSLPAGDAMASILPGKQPIPHRMRASVEEQRSQEITGDHPEPEASSYRLALERMAGAVLSLRQQVTSLEVDNRHLRHSLASWDELRQELLTDGDMDVMTREELLDRMGTLKHQLVAGAAEMRRLKDRVQQLQNELIRKNDREKELVLLQQAHRQQQTALRRCREKVAKMKGLEEAVRQQEKVMEVMERVLQEKPAGTGRSTGKLTGEGPSREVYTVLLAENCRLREELARAPHHLPRIAPQSPALPGGFGAKEKLSLLARLEEAQARGRVLEKQLEEAARSWGREKQELGTRLLEREHGFPHIPTTVSTGGEPGTPHMGGSRGSPPSHIRGFALDKRAVPRADPPIPMPPILPRMTSRAHLRTPQPLAPLP
ncbi:coiled-coil domain-containing protein 33 [Neopsephotus bourkii]|uniref:coiled-coil domain-containing protein 33 n=1 Tax=Neopsephotus bourkii TaxID=309878 RepID=UPI002AA5A75A|nr:coiled-coil domain-containing protein 33 [Neopsephotus bourkii]